MSKKIINRATSSCTYNPLLLLTIANHCSLHYYLSPHVGLGMHRKLHSTFCFSTLSTDTTSHKTSGWTNDIPTEDTLLFSQSQNPITLSPSLDLTVLKRPRLPSHKRRATPVTSYILCPEDWSLPPQRNDSLRKEVFHDHRGWSYKPGCHCRVEYKLQDDRLSIGGTTILTAEKMEVFEVTCPRLLG